MQNEDKDMNPQTGGPQEVKTIEEKISGMEKSLAEKDAVITSIQKDLEEAKKIIVETSLDLSEAVTAYKELVVHVNPDPVAAMVKGNTIAEINASLKSAKELVSCIKQEVNAESARVKVPAGAPPRTSPDLSGLSAREKIRFGMGG